MQTLKDSLETCPFRIPSPEARAEMARQAAEAEEEERKRIHVAKLRTANIPPEFKDADLGQCVPDVAAWVDRVKAGSRRNLILQGDPGTTKSYSASAALIALLEDRTGRFARETEIVTRIRDAIDAKETIGSIIENYSSPAILVLDDFGKAKHSDTSLAILWEILDNRDVWHRPTIFTMQGDSRILAERLSTERDQGYTAAAIVDRMKNSDVVKLTGKSRRGRRV